MASYAGHLYYHLYDSLFATLLTNTVSIGCVILFQSFKENFYALAAIVGTYLVPILINVSSPDLHQLSIYYLFWGIAYSTLAISLKNRIFIGLAAYLGIFTLACFANFDLNRVPRADIIYLIGFQACQFLLFTLAVVIFSVKLKLPLSKKESWSFFPVLLLFYATEFQLIYHINKSIAPWCALYFAAVIYAAYYVAKKILSKSTFESFPMVATFLSLVALHALYLNILPPFLRPWSALLILFGIVNITKSKDSIEELWPAFTILSWIVVSEFYKSVTTYHPTLESVIINFAFSMLLFYIARDTEKYENKFNIENFSNLLYGLSSLQFLCGQKYVSEIIFPRSISHFATSALWGLSALALLLLARNYSNQKYASASLVIFGIVAAKVLLFDLSTNGPTARIIALLGIGVLFYTGGYIYRQMIPKKFTDKAN